MTRTRSYVLAIVSSCHTVVACAFVVVFVLFSNTNNLYADKFITELATVAERELISSLTNEHGLKIRFTSLRTRQRGTEELTRSEYACVISVDRCDIKDSSLYLAKELPCIKWVIVMPICKGETTKIFTGTGLHAFAKDPNVERLSLWLRSADLQSSAWEAIGQLTQLRYLDLSAPRAKSQDYIHLGNLKNVEDLQLSHMNDDGFEGFLSNWLKDCKQLRKLHLESVMLQGSFLSQIPDACPLENLTIDCDFSSDKLIHDIGRLKHLKHLRIARPQIVSQQPEKYPAPPLTWEHLGQLANCPLETLYLESSFLNDKQLVELAKIKTLRRLEIHRARAEGTSIRAIGELPNLEYLVLNECPNLKAEPFKKINWSPVIKELRITGEKASENDAFLLALDGIDRKVFINFTRGKFSPGALEKFTIANPKTNVNYWVRGIPPKPTPGAILLKKLGDRDGR